MKRLVFVNRYFFPDHSATSQILSDLAFWLAKSGRAVAVVTSRQRYDDPGAHLPAQEKVAGVDIHRVATSRFGRSTLPGRALDYASFYLAAHRTLRRILTADDILVAKTDPPLISIVAALAARRCGAALVNWLQDLYPEVAVALGVPFLQGPVAHAASWLRNRSLQHAAANVVLERRMAKRLADCGVPDDKVHVIQNWTGDEDITPIAPADTPLRREWGLADKFVVGYSGNLGRAHEFETILQASERLRNHADIVFLTIGGGHQVDNFARRVEERGLEHIYCFKPYQDRAALSHSLCVPDVHWLSLRPELEGLIVPSKFYGIAAAGRPIIAISAPDGDIARLVAQHDCGFVVAPGDSASLAAALTRLSRDPALVDAMGRRARTMLDQNFTRRQAFARWSALLARLAANADM